MNTTIVIGLGEIGKPLFNILSKRKEQKTIGVDIQPVEIKESTGIMHVCYPFQLKKDFVQTTVDYCKKYKPAVVVVNSTVTPGTSEDIEIASGIPAVYSPVRGKHTRMESELVNYQKFVAGNSSDAVQQVEEHFKLAGMETHRLSNPRTLELAKLLETTYFGLLIAWAQEIDRFAKNVGGDYNEITEFFQEISYLPPFVFQPGFIGGHCVMPNIELLKKQFASEFLNAIKNSNDRKAVELSGDKLKLSERVEPVRIAK